jgi:hypothetical protein
LGLLEEVTYWDYLLVEIKFRDYWKKYYVGTTGRTDTLGLLYRYQQHIETTGRSNVFELLVKVTYWEYC